MVEPLHKKRIDFSSLKNSPLLWIYSAYLTIRFVDEWNIFPAIKFNGFVRVKFKKNKKSLLVIHSQLLFEQWLNGDEITTIQMSAGTRFEILSDFLIGNGMKISLSENATLIIKGKKNESASGITANSIILVSQYLEIGYDCLLAWDIFLTDSDWHQIIGQQHTIPTVIGDHVWIGAGSKILKGCIIGDNTIIASQSVVLQGVYESKSLLAGIPAKEIKNNIAAWSREMQKTNK